MPRKPKQRCKECVWYHPHERFNGKIIGTLYGDCKYKVEWPVLPESFGHLEHYQLETYRYSITGNSGTRCPCFTRGEPDSGLKEANK